MRSSDGRNDDFFGFTSVALAWVDVENAEDPTAGCGMPVPEVLATGGAGGACWRGLPKPGIVVLTCEVVGTVGAGADASMLVKEEPPVAAGMLGAPGANRGPPQPCWCWVFGQSPSPVQLFIFSVESLSQPWLRATRQRAELKSRRWLRKACVFNERRSKV